jgi:hypothetical protein
MNQKTLQVMFSLIRSAILKEPLTPAEKEDFAAIKISDLILISREQDLVHLVAFAIKENGLLPEKASATIQKSILQAVLRNERLSFVTAAIFEAFEKEKIPFLPLKGAILKEYYPEPWMRTSCDADILIRPEDLDRASKVLTEKLSYQKRKRTSHDIPFIAPSGEHIELHFDLLEENRANHAIKILKKVWNEAAPVEKESFYYRMSDEFFYFYHIAHMAKHIEVGGCGVRPFLDLYLLDQKGDENKEAREALLKKGGLSHFAQKAKKLSRVWFGGEEPDRVSLMMQSYIFRGGLYGSFENKVAVSMEKGGGKLGYLFRRIFVPTEKLARYYPVLEKKPYLAPIMQVRRWFMLFDPYIFKMAKSEIKNNFTIENEKSKKMKSFMDEIGL